MPDTAILILAALILLAAVLYSSVGHAGASAYLAAMALVGVAPAVMKPTALTLNILVATIATVQFARAGCFSWRLFWPFAAASIPAAYAGGAITLPGHIYKPVVGLILLFAAARMLQTAGRKPKGELRRPPVWAALLAGALLGLLAGLTGTGGGIFLSPLLLFARWAEPRQTAGVSAAFVLVNSVSGLIGARSTIGNLPEEWWLLAAAAVGGGIVGSTLGSRRLTGPGLRRLLGVVLVIAGVKMILA